MTDEKKPGDFTEKELAALADRAEEMERVTPNPDWKKAYGAIRQGADWLLRRMASARQT